MSTTVSPNPQKLDSEKRILLSNASCDSYFVEYLSGGYIILRPENAPGLCHPITTEEFQMIMESAQNFKKGLVSDVIDLYEDDGLDDSDDDDDDDMSDKTS